MKLGQPTWRDDEDGYLNSDTWQFHEWKLDVTYLDNGRSVGLVYCGIV